MMSEQKLAWLSREAAIACLAVLALAVHLVLRLSIPEVRLGQFAAAEWPLLATLFLGGLPLVFELAWKALRREFGSDLLAGMSIVTAILLKEYLAGAIVVLMLAGGATLEAYAVRRASSALRALAQRLPSVAHCKVDGQTRDVPLDSVQVGAEVVVYPHEVCPVDGTVIEGHSVMDESYLTGEPFLISKTAGASVLSGAVNGEGVLTVRADRRAVDSRFTRIMAVMRETEQRRPRLRRLGDQLGALYTPLALALAVLAWLFSGEPIRFLAVLVVATPCPLLIAIPVAILGSVSLAARRGIIIKDPAVVEQIDLCSTAIFDKTGTLTYGEPRLTELFPAPGYQRDEVLYLMAALEQYSKHPLASAVLKAAKKAGWTPVPASQVSEKPGGGLSGVVGGRVVQVTSRKKLLQMHPELANELPAEGGGLECVVLIDGRYAATLRFRDAPRAEGAPFINHLASQHHFTRVLLVSGDRESEVRYLAEQVGITEIHAGKSPEEKVALVRAETERAPTVFLGDGINDAPALAAATVGIAFGSGSDVTAEAAGAVIMDSSLARVDEFLHIGSRLRQIALQSAIGGMILSMAGMLLAALGYLPPVGGALLQEAIDVAAIVNALRVAIPPRRLTDYDDPR